MNTDLVCPTCGTVSHVDEVTRDAESFCRVCDYPLFWTRVSVSGSGESALAGDPGLRRLPGTAGRVTIATIGCPVCTEPNPVTRSLCLRCTSILRPVAVVVLPPPPPEPTTIYHEPPPPPAEPWGWPVWMLCLMAGILFLIAIGLFVLAFR